MELWITDRYL